MKEIKFFLLLKFSELSENAGSFSCLLHFSVNSSILLTRSIFIDICTFWPLEHLAIFQKANQKGVFRHLVSKKLLGDGVKLVTHSRTFSDKLRAVKP